ncbi:MAG: DUF4398 domain-containing protein [Dyella sp.]
MVHNSLPQRRAFRAAPLTLALGLLLATTLAGCASAPPPDGAMNTAQAQLREARDAGAANYAPVDLDFAQSRFQQAQMAMSKRKYDEAFQLANEAGADAELAKAKARLGAARAQVQSKTGENQRLRAQMEQAAQANDNSQPSQGFAPVDPSSGVNPPADAEMPAPSSSDLAVPAGQGFQTVPQPANQGGQP